MGNFISDLRLSPHTRLVIEVDFHGGINFGRDGGSYFGTSLAELSGGGTFDRVQLGRNDDALSASHSDTLSLMLTNSGTVTRKESISLYSYASASYIVPVPEPSSYAMLGLGLMLLCVLAARRKQARSPDYFL